jgi:hypothetical protein
MTTATVGAAYTLAFYSHLSGLAVEARVLEMTSGDATTVTLTESEPLSTEATRVYLGTFTPSATGWYVVHYTAVSGVTLVTTDIKRIEAVTASTSANPPVVVVPVTGGGSSTSTPAQVGNQSGTLTFTVRS